MDTKAIMLAFDALGLRVELFACTDGTIGAHLVKADIRALHTVNSLTGYAESADDALYDLWNRIMNMDESDLLRVVYGSDCKRYYRWNGVAWKEREVEQVSA